MRGTPSFRTTSACLPMARRTWQQASADPTASPSGRACDVSTNRSCCPICRSTSSTPLCLFSTGFLAGFVSFFRPRQQFLDSRLFHFRAVQTEIQFRGASQAQALDQFMPDVLARRFQTFQALVGICIVAFDIHPNLRRPAILGDMNCRHAHQPNSWIGQFAFNQGFNLLAQSFADPPAMILQPALLHDPPPRQVKRMRISENCAQMLTRNRYCDALWPYRDEYGGNRGLRDVAKIIGGF